MPRSNPLNNSIPVECPDCKARVKTKGEIFDQLKAKTIKFFGVIFLGALVIIGVLVLWIVIGRISIHLVLLVVGVSLIPSGIAFGIANQFPKIKEVKCSKCRWTECYYIASRESNV